MQYRRFTEAEKTEIWDRLAAGESMRAVAAAFDRFPSAIRSVALPSGGARPAMRKAREIGLTLAEREEISRGLAAKLSCRAIAARLVRTPSTITREVERNGGRARYRACSAERRARCCACRPKLAKLAQRPQLRSVVEAKLARR